MTIKFTAGLILLFTFLIGAYYLYYHFSIKPSRAEETKKLHKHL